MALLKSGCYKIGKCQKAFLAKLKKALEEFASLDKAAQALKKERDSLKKRNRKLKQYNKELEFGQGTNQAVREIGKGRAGEENRWILPVTYN